MHAQIINKSSATQNTVAVFAQVVHSGESIRGADKQQILAALSNATDNRLCAVSGSVTVVQDGRLNAMVRAVMAPARSVLPYEGNAEKMQALSKNMFIDQDDAIWTVSSGDMGKVLIKKNVVESEADLMSMMQSVSSVGFTATDPAANRTVETHMAALSAAETGDMVSYISPSTDKIEVGAVAFGYEEGGKFTVVPLGSESATSEVVASSALVGRLPSAQLDDWPSIEHASLSGSVDPNKLVDYYRRVFYYDPSYFEKLKAVIMNHSFA